MTDTTTASPARTPALASTRPCLCGCGLLTASVWYPGHDGKAKGLLRSVARGERTLADLPASLASVAGELAEKWGLATAETEGNNVVWTDKAKAPTTKRPAASHPAMRTLLRALDQLGGADSEAGEHVANAIAALRADEG